MLYKTNTQHAATGRKYCAENQKLCTGPEPGRGLRPVPKEKQRGAGRNALAEDAAAFHRHRHRPERSGSGPD